MNRIQFEEEQEQLEQDSKKLGLEKSCLNCAKNWSKCNVCKEMIMILGVCELENLDCSLHTMKDKEEG